MRTPTRKETPCCACCCSGSGALAVGTDAYVTAGLLPAIGRDLHEPASVTGQLVTVFMLCYALLAPLVGAALARWGIRQVLVAALCLFCLANAASALAPSLAALMVARGLAGVAAGVFMPVAATAAAALAGPERRDRALAVVLGGLSSGTVLGVPSGLLWPSTRAGGPRCGWSPRSAWCRLRVRRCCCRRCPAPRCPDCASAAPS